MLSKRTVKQCVPFGDSTQEERGIPPSVHRYTLLYIGVGDRYSSLLSFVICNDS